MDIRELLEQRKREIYGESSHYEDDTVMENLGDITGEYDDEDDLGDITMEYCNDSESEDLYGYFSDDEIREIELEAMQIEDPDTYMDDVLADATNDILEFVGESYINDLILEDALFECDNYEDLEVIEESIKSTVVDTKNKAVAKVKSLWSKFTSWIKNLMDNIKNHFMSGKKLVSKYKSEIISQYNKRGDKIRVKTYKYKYDNAAIKAAVSSLKYTFASLQGQNSKLEKSSVNKAYAKELNTKDVGGKSLREKAASCIRDKEKKNYKLKELDINVIITIASESKDAIKALKEFQKAENEFFKDKIAEIKNTDVDKEDKAGKQKIASQVSAAKRGASIGTTLVKAYISELKSANRACSAIIRKLLNKNGKGAGDSDSGSNGKSGSKKPGGSPYSGENLPATK